MAETLVELVARISADATELKKQLGDAEGQTKKSSENMAASLKKVGTAMAASGAVITAALGLAVKSAMGAVESENLFTVSLKNNAEAARKWSNDLGKSLGLNTYELRKNVGVMYTMISSMGIAEDSALDMSKGIVELANDMASFYNLPTEEAFAKLRAGLTGETEPLKRLGILVDEATIKTIALTNGIIQEGEELTQTQKVQARYIAILQQTTDAQGDLARTIDSPTNKLRILGSAVDELRIVIGENLLPVVGVLLNNISAVVAGVMAWAKEHPELAKVLTITALGLGVLLTVVGGLILILPTLISGIAAFGVVLGAVTGPVGIITLAVTGLIAGLMLLWKNWDAITDFFGDKTAKEAKRARESAEQELTALTKKVEEETKNQQRIRLNALYEEKEAVKAHYNRTIALLKAAFGEEEKVEKSKIQLAQETRDARLRFLDDVIAQTTTAHNAELSAINERYGVDASNQRSIRERTTENYNIRVQQIDDELAKADKNYNAQIAKLREIFGVSDAGNRSRMAMATEAANAAKRGLDEELKKAREVHSEKMAMLSEEYSKAMKTLAVRADKNIADIQKQIDAIDAQSKADEDARRRQAQVDKIADITYRLSKAKTAQEIANLEEELGKAYVQMEADKVAASRDADKQILQDIIDGIRQARTEEEAMAAFDLQVAQAVEKSKFDATIAATTEKQAALEAALTANIETMEAERAAAEVMEKAKFEDAKTNIQARRTEITTAYNNTLNEIESERVKAITAENEKFETTKNNLAWEKIEVTKWYEIELGQIQSERDAYIKAEEDKQRALQATITLQEKYIGLTSPGIATQSHSAQSDQSALIGPALGSTGAQPGIKLYPGATEGIVTGPTVAMVGEAGPKEVIPLNEGGLDGVTVNFSQPVFFDREDTMNTFVDMIRKGIQRQDRLRFGGAYNGT